MSVSASAYQDFDLVEDFNREHTPTLPRTRLNSVGNEAEQDGFVLVPTKERVKEEQKTLEERRLMKRWSAFIKDRGTEEEALSNADDELKILVRQGVPSTLRNKLWIWGSGAGSRMRENAGYYQFLLEKNEGKISPSIRQIDLDVDRTMPHIRENPDQKASLRRVLIAYSWRNPLVGYCQSMNFVAAILLLAGLSEEEVFWMLVTIVEIMCPDYYTKQLAGFHRDQLVLKDLLKEVLPSISIQLDKLGVSVSWMCLEWFLCLFAKTLPTEVTMQVWDCLFVEGQTLLFAVSLAMFRIHRQLILNARESVDLLEDFQRALTDPNRLDAHHLMVAAYHFLPNISASKLSKLRLRHHPEISSYLDEMRSRQEQRDVEQIKFMIDTIQKNLSQLSTLLRVPVSVPLRIAQRKAISTCDRLYQDLSFRKENRRDKDLLSSSCPLSVISTTSSSTTTQNTTSNGSSNASRNGSQRGSVVRSESGEGGGCSEVLSASSEYIAQGFLEEEKSFQKMLDMAHTIETDLQEMDTIESLDTETKIQSQQLIQALRECLQRIPVVLHRERVMYVVWKISADKLDAESIEVLSSTLLLYLMISKLQMENEMVHLLFRLPPLSANRISEQFMAIKNILADKLKRLLEEAYDKMAKVTVSDPPSTVIVEDAELRSPEPIVNNNNINNINDEINNIIKPLPLQQPVVVPRYNEAEVDASLEEAIQTWHNEGIDSCLFYKESFIHNFKFCVPATPSTNLMSLSSTKSQVSSVANSRAGSPHLRNDYEQKSVSSSETAGEYSPTASIVTTYNILCHNYCLLKNLLDITATLEHGYLHPVFKDLVHHVQMNLQRQQSLLDTPPNVENLLVQLERVREKLLSFPPSECRDAVEVLLKDVKKLTGEGEEYGLWREQLESICLEYAAVTEVPLSPRSTSLTSSVTDGQLSLPSSSSAMVNGHGKDTNKDVKEKRPFKALYEFITPGLNSLLNLKDKTRDAKGKITGTVSVVPSPVPSETQFASPPGSTLNQPRRVHSQSVGTDEDSNQLDSSVVLVPSEQSSTRNSALGSPVNSLPSPFTSPLVVGVSEPSSDLILRSVSDSMSGFTMMPWEDDGDLDTLSLDDASIDVSRRYAEIDRSKLAASGTNGAKRLSVASGSKKNLLTSLSHLPQDLKRNLQQVHAVLKSKTSGNSSNANGLEKRIERTDST